MASLLRTPLFDWHVAHHGRMVDYAGWAMPVQFAGVVHEHQAVRQRSGVFDVSHMGELVVTGADAVAAVDRLVTNNLGRLTDGRGLYTCCCNEEGGILDDLIVYRVSAREVLTVCNAANRAKIASHFRQHLPTDCTLDDQTDSLALLALQGPLASAQLEALFPGSATLRRFSLGEFARPGLSVRVARTGYTGEDGFEVFVAAEAATGLWEAFIAQGAEPIGLAARDTLRLEAALSLYGNDIDESTTPLEAGLGWTVKLDKADFIGKQALRRQHEAGVDRQLVGFEMIGRGIARSGYPLLAADGSPAGSCTSGSPAPTLGKSIGLGYVPTSMASAGTELLVDCRGRRVPAKVVPTPFYSRPKT